jgi:hypothetical protein
MSKRPELIHPEVLGPRCYAYGLALCSACIFVLTCVVASANAVQIEPATPCEQASADTAGWQEIDAGPFSIRLPAGYRRIDVLGTDSLIGRWELSATQLVAFSSAPVCCGSGCVQRVRTPPHVPSVLVSLRASEGNLIGVQIPASAPTFAFNRSRPFQDCRDESL